MNSLFKSIAVLTSTALLTSLMPLSANADMISNSSALIEQQANRTELKAFFDRQDVIAALEQHGVSAEMAKKRVDSMTNAEAEQLAQHIENEPAGAGVVGALFSVFIILLVTDILGFTKVFSFTRSIR